MTLRYHNKTSQTIQYFDVPVQSAETHLRELTAKRFNQITVVYKLVSENPLSEEKYRVDVSGVKTDEINKHSSE